MLRPVLTLVRRYHPLAQFPGIAVYGVQVQVTQQQGFGRFNLVTQWKRVYRNHQANEVWYLLTNLESLEAALAWGAPQSCKSQVENCPFR